MRFFLGFIMLLAGLVACGDRHIDGAAIEGYVFPSPKPGPGSPDTPVSLDDLFTVQAFPYTSLFGPTNNDSIFWLNFLIFRQPLPGHHVSAGFYNSKEVMIDLNLGAVSAAGPGEGAIRCQPPETELKNCKKFLITLNDFFPSTGSETGNDFSFFITEHGDLKIELTDFPEIDLGVMKIIEYEFQIGQEKGSLFTYRWKRGEELPWLVPADTLVVAARNDLAKHRFRDHSIFLQAPFTIENYLIPLLYQNPLEEEELDRLENFLRTPRDKFPLPFVFSYGGKAVSLVLSSENSNGD